LGLALTLQGLAAFAVNATPTYNISTSSADLGVVTSGTTGDTVFRIDPTAGSVTVISGTAQRSSSSSTRAMVTISCTARVAGDCTKNVNVQLATVGSPTGRARTLTRITFTMGTATLAGGPGPPGIAAFTIAPIGANASKTFFVGADLGIAGDDSGLPTGAAESDVSISAAETPPGTPPAATAGGTGRFTATVIRSIAISKTSDLVFGRIIRPNTGSGSVTIDPTSGARTAVNVQTLDTPSPSRAAFSITGEGGQAFAVTMPATVQMTGPQTLTLTTASSASATPSLSGTLGSQGSFVLGIGATAPLSSTTPTGDYSGSFTVTVAYN
jgi:hypothetical protein